MTLPERISRNADRLTGTDRRLLEVLLSHPTEASFLPAGEVARLAGVHQASATKLAQRLGYRGYPDLRRSLQHDLLEGVSAADRVQRRLEHAADGSLIDALVNDEVAALKALPRQVAQVDLDRAAELVLAADRRLVYGRGNASVLSELLVRRLRRAGLPALALGPSGRDLAEQLVDLTSGDVVVVFAFLRPPRHLADLRAACAEVGASMLMVTDTLTADGETGVDTIVLTGARGSGREFQSLSVPMAITNALVLTLARLAPERTGEALSRLDELLARFDH